MDSKQVRRLEAGIKESVKKCNDLIKIESILHDEEASTSVKNTAIEALRRLYCYFAEKGDLRAKTTDAKDAKAKYRTWLYEQYKVFLTTSISLLSDDDTNNISSNLNTQKVVLRTMMEFVQQEHVIQGNDSFGTRTLSRTLKTLVQSTIKASDFTSLLDIFQSEYLEPYCDVRFYTMQTIKSIAGTTSSSTTTSSSSVVDKLWNILTRVSVSKDAMKNKSYYVTSMVEENTTEEESDDSSDEEEEQEPATKKAKTNGPTLTHTHRKAFSEAWLAFLKLNLSSEQYLLALEYIPSNVLPYMTQPLMLADFFTDSYNVGGMASMLALNGLFILIQEHNFDYEEFYNKLYQLVLDVELFKDCENRQRFFQLLALFLSSSHLPAYVIASFAKRLCRIAVTSGISPGAIVYIIPFVYNLVIKHSECLQLIHRGVTGKISEEDDADAALQARNRREALSCESLVEQQAREAVAPAKMKSDGTCSDPFNNGKSVLMASSNALASSLWEIMTLKRHYCANVAILAAAFEEKAIRKNGYDLSEFEESTYESIFTEQIKRRVKQPVPLAFESVSGVFDFKKTEDSVDVFKSVFK